MTSLLLYPMVSSDYGSVPVTLIGVVAAMVKEMLIAALLDFL